MRLLVTGSAGHLGEALLRRMADGPHAGVGLDVTPSDLTDVVGSITDAALVAGLADEVDGIIHTAALHKPHVGTHRRQAFVDVNVSGTLTLLEAAAARRLGAFVLTSSTSAFGRALSPPPGGPAAWIDENVRPRPRNVYGVTKLAAEDLVELTARDLGLPCLVLRTSRFFPEADDDPGRRALGDANLKAVEYLHRRVALEDVADAHLLAAERAADVGFHRLVVSAPSPFEPSDAGRVRYDLASLLDERVPEWAAVADTQGWTLPAGLDRVYDSRRARDVLGWRPQWDVHAVLAAVADGAPVQTPLSRRVGAKGYHPGGLVAGMYRTA